MKAIRTSICVLLLLVASTASAQSLDRAKQLIEQGQYKEAAVQLRPLADGGNAEAQYLAATLFFEGKGVNKSEAQGEKYAMKAISQGNIEAFTMLYQHFSLTLPFEESEKRKTEILDIFMKDYSNRLADYLYNGGEDVGFVSEKMATYYADKIYTMPAMKRRLDIDDEETALKVIKENIPKVLDWQKKILEDAVWKDMATKARKKTTPIAYKYMFYTLVRNIYDKGFEYGFATYPPLAAEVGLQILFFPETDHFLYKYVKTNTTAVIGRYLPPGEIVYAEPEQTKTKRRSAGVVKEQAVNLPYKNVAQYLKNNLNTKPSQITTWRLPDVEELEMAVRVLWQTGHQVEGYYWTYSGEACEFDEYGQLVRTYAENQEMSWKCHFITNN